MDCSVCVVKCCKPRSCICKKLEAVNDMEVSRSYFSTVYSVSRFVKVTRFFKAKVMRISFYSLNFPLGRNFVEAKMVLGRLTVKNG